MTAIVLMMWSGVAAAELSCKDFRRGYMLSDPDLLRSMAQIAIPLILAENGGTMPDDRTLAFRDMTLRLENYCDQLPDDSVDAIVASMLKTAPERYAEAEKQRTETAARQAEAEKEQAYRNTTAKWAAQPGAIGDFVRRCWSTDPGMPDLDKMAIRLTVTTDGSGVVRRAVVAQEDVSRVSGNPRLRVFSERAVRAVLDPNCASLPLPQSMLGQTRVLTFEFRP
jgi:hypothetical protein